MSTPVVIRYQIKPSQTHQNIYILTYGAWPIELLSILSKGRWGHRRLWSTSYGQGKWTIPPYQISSLHKQAIYDILKDMAKPWCGITVKIVKNDRWMRHIVVTNIHIDAYELTHQQLRLMFGTSLIDLVPKDDVDFHIYSVPIFNSLWPRDVRAPFY